MFKELGEAETLEHNWNPCIQFNILFWEFVQET